jgi:hypothetical protein
MQRMYCTLLGYLRDSETHLCLVVIQMVSMPNTIPHDGRKFGTAVGMDGERSSVGEA